MMKIPEKWSERVIESFQQSGRAFFARIVKDLLSQRFNGRRLFQFRPFHFLNFGGKEFGRIVVSIFREICR